MLADVDLAVAALLETERLGGQAAKVAFDAPKKEWAAARTAPTLNLFLADIREDLSRRTTTLIEVMGEDGIVESRRQPFRFFNLTYALTAWASRPEDDHQLLGLALRALIQYDYIPERFCGGELAQLLQQGHNLHLRVGGKIFSDRFATELWSAMGTDYHPFVSVVVSLPVESGVAEPVGPPQTVPPQVVVSSSGDSLRETIRGRDPKAPDAGIRTRKRGSN